MKLKQVSALLNARVICGEELLEKRAEHVFCTDVMADVLAFSEPDAVLITRLHDLSVVRSCLMADIPCVVLSDGILPSPEFISLAEAQELVVMTVPGSMFRAVEILLDAGLNEADWS